MGFGNFSAVICSWISFLFGLASPVTCSCSAIIKEKWDNVEEVCISAIVMVPKTYTINTDPKLISSSMIVIQRYAPTQSLNSPQIFSAATPLPSSPTSGWYHVEVIRIWFRRLSSPLIWLRNPKSATCWLTAILKPSSSGDSAVQCRHLPDARKLWHVGSLTTETLGCCQ